MKLGCIARGLFYRGTVLEAMELAPFKSSSKHRGYENTSRRAEIST